MAEYIDRETAIKAVEKADYTAIADDADSCKADYLREIIESVPAADVVPVVRCKNCKYAYINSFSVASGVVFCSSSMKAMQQDDFCSYGERMDGGADNEIRERRQGVRQYGRCRI